MYSTVSSSTASMFIVRHILLPFTTNRNAAVDSQTALLEMKMYFMVKSVSLHYGLRVCPEYLYDFHKLNTLFLLLGLQFCRNKLRLVHKFGGFTQRCVIPLLQLFVEATWIKIKIMSLSNMLLYFIYCGLNHVRKKNNYTQATNRNTAKCWTRFC